MEKGKIKYFNESKKYGFITNTNGNDIYFKFASLDNKNHLYKDADVCFKLNNNGSEAIKVCFVKPIEYSKIITENFGFGIDYSLQKIRAMQSIESKKELCSVVLSNEEIPLTKKSLDYLKNINDLKEEDFLSFKKSLETRIKKMNLLKYYK
jgi:cold shock CspA family protein